MNFYGIIQKLSLITKKSGDVETDYVQLTVLVPANSKTSIADFAKHYHETSAFELSAIQGDLGEM